MVVPIAVIGKCWRDIMIWPLSVQSWQMSGLSAMLHYARIR